MTVAAEVSGTFNSYFAQAEADSNFVLTGQGGIVEIQATGEKRGFSRAEFDRLFELAGIGCDELFALQKTAVG